jgi:hypothetical protein
MGSPAGRPLVVAGSEKAERGRAYLLDLAKWMQIGEPLPHIDLVVWVAVGELGGHPLVVSSDNGGWIQIWDVASGAKSRVNLFGLPATPVFAAVAPTGQIVVASTHLGLAVLTPLRL